MLRKVGYATISQLVLALVPFAFVPWYARVFDVESFKTIMIAMSLFQLYYIVNDFGFTIIGAAKYKTGQMSDLERLVSEIHVSRFIVTFLSLTPLFILVAQSEGEVKEFFTLIAMIVVSWIAPGSRHPAIELIWQVSEPVMAPFRALLPNMGGIDFSPILVFISINVVQIGLRHLALSVGLPPGLVFGL